jgi:hypothetical protein
MFFKKKKNYCILVSGFAGSGKDEIGRYLESKYKFHKDSLAAPVKSIASLLWNVNDLSIFNDTNLKEKKLKDANLSPRKMCQIVGHELRGICGEDIWCENLIRRFGTNGNLVITDNRYGNEIQFFKKYFNVKSIRIQRNNFKGSVGFKNHKSESIDFDTDFIIQNDGTIDNLYNKIDDVMKEILK